MREHPQPDETFAQWFARQGFRNFTAREVAAYFSRARGSVQNSQPPRYLWHRFVATLKVVDDVRDHFGRPAILLSTYRSPAYNRAVGSSNPADPRKRLGPGSQHPRFAAADFRVAGVSARRVYELLLEWRRNGRFQGGLGLYVRSGFVHVDTRPLNATWRGN